MKLLDVWLFVGLVLPFIAFCLEVAEELTVQKEEDSTEEESNSRPITVASSGSVQPEKPNTEKEKKKKLSKTRCMIQFLARVVLPVFTVIFIISYIIGCIYSYDNPTLETD